METGDTVWKREYFSQPYQNPFLFYAVFGADTANLNVSKSRHNIDGMPEELEMINYSQANERQRNYIRGFYSDNFEELLAKKSTDLYTKVKGAQTVTVVKGEFEDGPTFDYLKNTIGITQALIETGAVAVLDMQILEWYEPQEWTEHYFEPKAPQTPKQAIILFSEDNDRIWLHTRGMRKFGRPDISIRNVTSDTFDAAKEIVGRFIQAFAHGALPNERQEIWLQGMKAGVYGKILGDYDNFDFNNYYFEITL